MREIFERRSIRQYTDKEVTNAEVEKLLRAAMQAPSACNEQTWEFIVVRDKEMLSALAATHPYAKMLPGASCAVLVCGNLERQVTTPHEYWIQDCSAATQNLLLEAVHLGIGAVWIGVHPIMERSEKIRKMLGLPEHVLPLNMIALGYPAKRPAKKDAYKEEYVHWEKW